MQILFLILLVLFRDLEESCLAVSFQSGEIRVCFNHLAYPAFLFGGELIMQLYWQNEFVACASYAFCSVEEYHELAKLRDALLEHLYSPRQDSETFKDLLFSSLELKEALVLDFWRVTANSFIIKECFFLLYIFSFSFDKRLNSRTVAKLKRIPV